MKNKLKYLCSFLVVVSVFFSCTPDPELDPTFSYYVAGDESNPNPQTIYVGQSIVFRTPSIEGGENFIVWFGDSTHVYSPDGIVSDNDSTLNFDRNTGTKMIKVQNESGEKFWYQITYTYRTSSGPEGFEVYLISTADENNGEDRFSKELMKKIIVKDTTTTFSEFFLVYPEPSTANKSKDKESSKTVFSNDTIYCTIPYGIDLKKIKTTFKAGSSTVKVDGVTQYSTYSKTPAPTTVDFSGKIKQYVVTSFDENISNTYNVVVVYPKSGTSTIKSVVGLPATVDAIAQKINISLPQGMTQLPELIFSSVKQNIVYHNNDLIKPYYLSEFLFTPDINNVNDKITVYNSSGNFVDYSFNYTFVPMSFNLINLSEIAYNTPSVNGKEITFTENPQLISSLGSKFTPTFTKDQFTTVDVYINDVKVDSNIVSGAKQYNFSTPVKLKYTNGVATDSVTLIMQPF